MGTDFKTLHKEPNVTRPGIKILYYNGNSAGSPCVPELMYSRDGWTWLSSFFFKVIYINPTNYDLFEDNFSSPFSFHFLNVSYRARTTQVVYTTQPVVRNPLPHFGLKWITFQRSNRLGGNLYRILSMMTFLQNNECTKRIAFLFLLILRGSHN